MLEVVLGQVRRFQVFARKSPSGNCRGCNSKRNDDIIKVVVRFTDHDLFAMRYGVSR